MREICTSGSMNGEWKQSMAELVRHRQTKEPETDRPRLNHRATPRLYFKGTRAGSQNNSPRASRALGLERRSLRRAGVDLQEAEI